MACQIVGMLLAKVLMNKKKMFKEIHLYFGSCSNIILSENTSSRKNRQIAQEFLLNKM